MNKFIFLLLVALTVKTNFWDSPDAYLGQKPPGAMTGKIRAAIHQ